MKIKNSFIKLIHTWMILFLVGFGLTIICIDAIISYQDFNARADQMRINHINRQKQIIKQEVMQFVKN